MRISREKLTLELLRRDMTIKRLAELSGVTRATINAIKSGKSCADATGEKLAIALEMTMTELIEEG